MRRYISYLDSVGSLFCAGESRTAPIPGDERSCLKLAASVAFQALVVGAIKAVQVDPGSPVTKCFIWACPPSDGADTTDKSVLAVCGRS